MPAPSFDCQLETLVTSQFPGAPGERLILAYKNARRNLIDRVYGNIAGSEPSLTDHSANHVEHVQQNVLRLLSIDGHVTNLTGIEMYCLGMCILFHDAGIVYGRDNHHNNVFPVYDNIRGTDPSVRHEKTLVVRATRAHTGKAQDGSFDTLKEVAKEDHLEGRRVRLRELAAILRFADELAEGPQRTSTFMQAENLYGAGSIRYHNYSNTTHVFIQRENRRVVLTYEIAIQKNSSDAENDHHLGTLLRDLYNRVRKLNQERQYTRYYSALLEPFQSTEVTLNFHCDGDLLTTDLDTLKLTDIIVPGDTARDIPDIDPAYRIAELVPKILSRCRVLQLINGAD